MRRRKAGVAVAGGACRRWGRRRGVLEVAKFGVYVSVPVALTYLVATDSKTLKKLMGLVRAFSLSCLPESSLSSRGAILPISWSDW